MILKEVKVLNMRIKRLFSMIILALIVCVFFVLGLEISKPDVMPLKETYATIKISNEVEYHLIKEKCTIVYLLGMHCSHCQYQVESLLGSLEKFEKYDVLLLFISDDEVVSPQVKWSQLGDVSNVQVHEFVQEAASQIFGDGGVPRFYLFNSKGQLLKKILGEVKPDFLLNEMNALFVRAQS